MNVFAQFNETYEDAVKKNVEESQSFTKSKYFRIDAVGQYPVRILPIAPTLGEDGKWTLDRKGYEYPIKNNILALDNPNPKSKKDKKIYVPIIQATYAGISVDLIDTYVQVVKDKYADDTKLTDKIKSSSFNGGLKWSSQRAMYIYDMNKRSEGLQVLMLSYSQYKDLEDLKLQTWKDLLEQNPKAECPISSIANAYPVTISRKEENGKTSYTFNINIIKGVDKLSEEEMQALLDAPRLPEALYRYSKYHLEATIEYLKQYDQKMDLDIMSTKEISEAIEKIKLELPADDTSHFSFTKNSEEEGAGENTLDSLWDRWEDLKKKGISDKDEEGQNLRDDIRDFIDDNDLDVRASRSKTNEDLLNAIEDAMENQKSADDVAEETAEEEKVVKTTEEKESKDDEEEEEDEDEPSDPRQHNDDTDEPAVHAGRRSSRPARRRAR